MKTLKDGSLSTVNHKNGGLSELASSNLFDIGGFSQISHSLPF
jgi:hypothetical protein